MKKLLFIIILLVAGIANAQTTTNISQYGITWTFADSESYGQFANGDYWVVHPVTINSITPTQTSTRNGTEVNPTAADDQGFDERANNFDSGLQISLPHTSSASQIESIVSSDSTGEPGSSPYLDNVAVLTILLSTPPDDGAYLFRPGYCGTDKTYYYTTDLQTGELLTIDTTETGDSFAELEGVFERPQIEMGEGATNRRLRAANNMYNNYAPANAGQLNEAISKLSGDWTVNEKNDLLIYVVQAGIDRYNAALSGQTWPAGGGHQPGHKLNIVFAGYMLDEADILDEGLETYFWENRLVIEGKWGAVATETDYWDNVTQDRSQMYDYGDPYHYIDGGTTMTEVDVDNYQTITVQTCKGAVCWLRYYPDMQDHWSDSDDFITYAERWVSHGLLALPDPCAPVPANEIGRNSGTWLAYGSTWGSNGAGGCITGSGGRFANGTPTSAQRDGDYTDTGQYASDLTDEMWDLYEEPPEAETATVRGMSIN